jgi:hypothetical protein
LGAQLYSPMRQSEPHAARLTIRGPTFALDLDNAAVLNWKWNGRTEGAALLGEFGLRV